MAPRTISMADRKLPPNPEFLDWPRSDGDPRRWRTDTVLIEDQNHHINYHRIIEDQEGPSIHWREDIAAYVAQVLGLPGQLSCIDV